MIFKNLLFDLDPIFPIRYPKHTKIGLIVKNTNCKVRNEPNLKSYLIPSLQSLDSIETDKSSTINNQDLAIVSAGKLNDSMIMTNEIMKNFIILKNFEMKRTRDSKSEFDNNVLNSYLEVIFGVIQDHSTPFLKAFSKPIQHDYLQILENFKNDLSSDIYNLQTNPNSCVLTANLNESINMMNELDFDSIDISWFDEQNIPLELIFGSDYQQTMLHIENYVKFKRKVRRQTSKSARNSTLLTDEQKDKLIFYHQSRKTYQKAIFDCINECLNETRPYGVLGGAMPWSITQ